MSSVLHRRLGESDGRSQPPAPYAELTVLSSETRSPRPSHRFVDVHLLRRQLPVEALAQEKAVRQRGTGTTPVSACRIGQRMRESTKCPRAPCRARLAGVSGRDRLFSGPVLDHVSVGAGPWRFGALRVWDQPPRRDSVDQRRPGRETRDGVGDLRFGSGRVCDFPTRKRLQKIPTKEETPDKAGASSFV